MMFVLMQQLFSGLDLFKVVTSIVLVACCDMDIRSSVPNFDEILWSNVFLNGNILVMIMLKQ